MSTITFHNPALKRQFASYKWARNNTLQLLKAALDANILGFTPSAGQHTVLYQFQCLATTDDAYFRILTHHADKRFGIIVTTDGDVKKQSIDVSNLESFLQQGMRKFESLLATYSDDHFVDNAQVVQSIFNHEYLHQGQLVVLFRLAGVPLPARFKTAFDL